MTKTDKPKKWKYSELLEKHKSLFTKSANVYIPELFDLLKEEHPDWSNWDLEARITRDLKGIVKPSMIRKVTVKLERQRRRRKELSEIRVIDDGCNTTLD